VRLGGCGGATRPDVSGLSLEEIFVAVHGSGMEVRP